MCIIVTMFASANTPPLGDNMQIRRIILQNIAELWGGRLRRKGFFSGQAHLNAVNHRDGVFDSIVMKRGKENMNHLTYDKVENIAMSSGERTGSLSHRYGYG